MSNTFYERIARGNNLTKMGSGSNPRDVAMLISAQARAPVDCPTLQAVGPQATNQAVKAIAIARTFLRESDSVDSARRNAIPALPSPPPAVFSSLPTP